MRKCREVRQNPPLLLLLADSTICRSRMTSRAVLPSSTVMRSAAGVPAELRDITPIARKRQSIARCHQKL